MRAYEAWLKANCGERIYRTSRPGTILRKTMGGLFGIEIFGIDFSTDDWEIEKEKHILILVNTDFLGGPLNKTLSEIIREKGLTRPNLFTKITLEWEE